MNDFVMKTPYTYDQEKLTAALVEIPIPWGKDTLTNTQICINSRIDSNDPLVEGCGSQLDSYGNKRFEESEFVVFNDYWAGTYIEELYNIVTGVAKVGRVRIMRAKTRSCYSIHRDFENRIHAVGWTNSSAFLLEDVNDTLLKYHVPADGHLYYAQTKRPHTAANFNTKNDRVHIVFNIIEEYVDFEKISMPIR